MDTVFIHGLRIDTFLGIHPWERQARQTVVLFLELGFDNQVPAASDAIADTLDYQRAADRIRLRRRSRSGRNPRRTLRRFFQAIRAQGFGRD